MIYTLHCYGHYNADYNGSWRKEFCNVHLYSTLYTLSEDERPMCI
jgi:hypothetical protein